MNTKRQKSTLKLFIALLAGVFLILLVLKIHGNFEKPSGTHQKPRHSKLVFKQHKIQYQMQKKQLSGSIYYSDNNHNYCVNRGDINKEFKMSNSLQQPFPIYSITKLLTGIMIEQLVHQGRLSMSTTLNQFYPQIPLSNNITIRQLLDHNSGINMGETTPDHLLTSDDDSVQYTIQHMQVTNIHQWNYSDANYTLLAGILDKITNNSYANNLNQQITKPLHLKHTFAWVPDNNQVVQSYTGNDSQTSPLHFDNNLISAELGCGNVFSSVSDLSRILMSLKNSQLLSKSEYLQLTNNYQSNKANNHYAGGLYYRSNTAFAYGSDNGFQTTLKRKLQEQVSH